ncbi:MAG: outer membrane protein assembly factor BamC [Burkholderiales bacterium]
MMMKKFYPAMSIVIMLTQAGCAGWFGGDKNEYQNASKQAPLEVPPGLSSPAGDDRYVVPDAKGSINASQFGKDRPAAKPQAAGLPAQSGVLPTVGGDVRMERAGTQRWLVVKSTPEQLWPLLQDFWKSAGYELPVLKPDVGVMETNFKENRAAIKQDAIRNLLGKLLDNMWTSPERDKFRTRLERATDGMTEVYISHQALEEVYTSDAKDRTAWQPRPPNPEKEAEMLNLLMAKLGTPQPTSVAAVSGASGAVAKAEERAVLRKSPDGVSLLAINDNFDRAWRRVGLSLDRVGFTVEDRDRSKGVYFVRYTDPEAEALAAKKGLLDSLAFWRPDEKTKAKPYRIHLSGETNMTQVVVENADGAAEKSATAERILNLLLAELK